MRLYYWNKKRNFGDALSSHIIKKFTNLDSEWSPVQDAQIVAIGSILEHLPKDWGGIIAGTGKLHEQSIIDISAAKVMALRGPLSAKGVKGSFAMGDLGLLADELVPNEDKEFDLGLIPHWSDDELEHNPEFTKFNPKIIRVSDDPVEVVRQIGKCKKIVSSSLHGIILADAFGLPRRIEISPKMLIDKYDGSMFKWMDYCESIGSPFEPGKTKEVNKNSVNRRQHELFDVLEEIKSIFSNGKN